MMVLTRRSSSRRWWWRAIRLGRGTDNDVVEVDAEGAVELSELLGQDCVDLTDMLDDSFFMNSILAMTLRLNSGPVTGPTFLL